MGSFSRPFLFWACLLHLTDSQVHDAAMRSLNYRPGAPLAAFVDQFWYRRGYAPSRKRERALPTGSVDLVFNLHDDLIRTFADEQDSVGVVTNGAVVHGPQSRYFVLDARRHVHVVGVHFRPGGAALFGIAGPELADRHVPLQDIWGAAAIHLRERLLESPMPQAMFALLESELLARLPPRPLVHPAVSFALRRIASLSAESIADVQQQTGYSPRRFVTLFNDAVGLAPKTFSRIQRLRKVVDRVAHGNTSSWADIAADHGYYDQSHLTREFRELSGVTPAAYRPVSPESALHMEVAEESDQAWKSSHEKEQKRE
jgi:AraC-like DNA-binding protein